MEIVEEKFFEDAEGFKKRTKFIASRDKFGKPKFMEEEIHLEVSQQFIDEQINPRIEMSNRFREKEERNTETNRKFEEWKKEKFGK